MQRKQFEIECINQNMYIYSTISIASNYAPQTCNHMCSRTRNFPAGIFIQLLFKVFKSKNTISYAVERCVRSINGVQFWIFLFQLILNSWGRNMEYNLPFNTEIFKTVHGCHTTAPCQMVQNLCVCIYEKEHLCNIVALQNKIVSVTKEEAKRKDEDLFLVWKTPKPLFLFSPSKSIDFYLANWTGVFVAQFQINITHKSLMHISIAPFALVCLVALNCSSILYVKSHAL